MTAEYTEHAGHYMDCTRADCAARSFPHLHAEDFRPYSPEEKARRRAHWEAVTAEGERIRAAPEFKALLERERALGRVPNG